MNWLLLKYSRLIYSLDLLLVFSRIYFREWVKCLPGLVNVTVSVGPLFQFAPHKILPWGAMLPACYTTSTFNDRSLIPEPAM